LIVIIAKNLELHELIGLEAKVVDSSNESNIGIHGMIVDESKNMIIIDGKKVLKKDAKFEIIVDNEKVVIDGNNLLKGPVERIKSR
jgi:ribonuclease P protein subunit POP4